MARELGALFTHPCVEAGDKWSALLLAHGLALIGAEAIDGSLDLEQSVDALNRLQRDRRDYQGFLAPRLSLCIGLDISQNEELAPAMAPARRLEDRTGTAAWLVKLLVAAIGVGLQNAGKTCEMALGMFAGAVVRVIEHRRRRILSAERLIIAHIDPTSGDVGLALG
jgi:hypothetical protein